MKLWLVAVVALVMGFALGYLVHPSTPAVSGDAGAPPVAGSGPTAAEATAAVRRFKPSDPLLHVPFATLTLSECAPSKISTGVECDVTLTPRPGDKPGNRLVGFARFNGQWERTY